MNDRRTGVRIKWTRFTLTGVLLAVLIFLVPVPYVVVKPGSAEPLDAMVAVEDGYEQAGTFMLTTIRMWYYPNMNLATTVYGLVHPYAHVSTRSAIFGDDSEQEYTRRQEYVMLNSQSNAIQAAYREAGIPYEIETTGVMVLNTVEGMPAADVMQPGDRLLKLDDSAIYERNDVFAFMDDKNIGDEVQVTYEREGEVREGTIVLGDLSQFAGGSTRPGLGIEPVDMQIVKPDDPAKQVDVSAGAIGGPSAGLMFALEIYNRLTEDDLTRGYNIAGTGTITPAGEVGIIGGIDYKVVAAHRKGADIFFAPVDYEPDEGSGGQPIPNASIAREQAERLGTPMKVVAVSTLAEAIDYLESLDMKGD